MDIGGSKIAAGVTSEDGRVLAQRTCATMPERGFDDAMHRIESMLREAIAEAGEIAGLGVGCPGPLDPVRGVLGNVGTLVGWEGAELAATLAARLGVSVAVENDADAAALAEYRLGSGLGSSRFFYIAVSTGIGGGLLVDGRLYRGLRGAHPEFGHQVLDANGPRCYCTANGCWESLASGTAMSAWMHEQEPEKPAASAAEICARAEAGEALARRAVEREGYYLGLGLANLVTLFAPERIALGGGVMKSAALFLEPARRIVRELCTQVPAEYVAIDAAALGNDAGLLGAAQCWLQREGEGTAAR